MMRLLQCDVNALCGSADTSKGGKESFIRSGRALLAEYGFAHQVPSITYNLAMTSRTVYSQFHHRKIQ